MENIKTYHGYIVVPRHSKLLFQKLGYSLFGFHIALVMNAIWFRGNPHFGHVVKTQVQLARELNIKQSTVSRKLDKLELKHCIVKHGDYISIGYFPLFLQEVAIKIHSKNYSNLQELNADIQQINTELQKKYAKLQDKGAQEDYQRLNSSSKDDLSSLEESLDKEDEEK